jgi:hypothetical protein
MSCAGHRFAMLSVCICGCDVGAVAPVVKGVAKIVDYLYESRREFAPPFLPLGSATPGLYRAALGKLMPQFPTAAPGRQRQFEADQLIPAKVHKADIQFGVAVAIRWASFGLPIRRRKRCCRHETSGLCGHLRHAPRCRFCLVACLIDCDYADRRIGPIVRSISSPS